MYIVISKPKRKSQAEGVSHFMMCLLCRWSRFGEATAALLPGRTQDAPPPRSRESKKWGISPSDFHETKGERTASTLLFPSGLTGPARIEHGAAKATLRAHHPCRYNYVFVLVDRLFRPIVMENMSPPAPETFSASPDSRLRKSRKYIWIGLGVGVAIPLLREGHATGPILIAGAFALLLGLIFHWMIGRQIGSGVLLTLDGEGLHAPGLSGPAKRLLWTDIEGVALSTANGAALLTFTLAALTRADAKQATLNLAPFSPDVQERIIDAIEWRRHCSATPLAPARSAPEAMPNELREEREFHEQLKALQPIPYATWTLIALNVLIWLGTLALGANVLAAPAEKLFLWGGNAASEVQKGEIWRLVTATFLHNGAIHVAMNMLGLYSAGVMVERIYGQRLFLFIYLASGLLGSAFSLHYAAQKGVSVGASGAVFGVTGALLVALIQHRERIPKGLVRNMTRSLGLFIVYSLANGLSAKSIDNAAHVGGLMAGVIAAFVLPERLDMEHFRRTMKQRVGVAAALLGLTILGASTLAPAASIDQRRIVENSELGAKALKEFERLIKALEQEHKEVQAGTLSEQEADDRSRTVYAPAFREVIADLAKVQLVPNSPRGELIANVRKMSELLYESLAMASIRNPETGKLEPADRERANEIEKELATASARFKDMIEAKKRH